MKRYLIRVNCASFEDIEVEANNKQEAIDLALIEFTCGGSSPEFGEIISISKGE